MSDESYLSSYNTNEYVIDNNIVLGKQELIKIDNRFHPTEQQIFYLSRSCNFTKSFTLDASVMFLSLDGEDTLFALFPSNEYSNDTMICKMWTDSNTNQKVFAMGFKNSTGQNIYTRVTPAYLNLLYTINVNYDGSTLICDVNGHKTTYSNLKFKTSNYYTRLIFNGHPRYSGYTCNADVHFFRLIN